MTRLIADEECLLCLGTAWVQDEPRVIGVNEDGSDILSDVVLRRCRCAEEVTDEDEDDDDDHTCYMDSDDVTEY